MFDPLTDKHKDVVRMACAKCKEAEEYFNAVEKIGIDVSQQREQLEAFRQLFHGIRQQFMPGEDF